MGLWVPTSVEAAPVVALVGTAFSWAAAVLTPIFGATITAALINFGVSAILALAAGAFRSKPKQQDVIRELQYPTSLPPWRFVYGKCWAPGSPAPIRVKGGIIYACFILNSRPSAGPFTLYLDKREVVVSGDPYNFAGGGAAATNAPFSGWCTYWIGRGDQTSPPGAFLSGAPEHFTVSDGWQGMTTLWLRIDAGPNESRTERWPATPPEVMVDGFWSKVWDPRDTAQDPDDASTWTWSANQALCTLDTLRQNPVKPYPAEFLWLDSFAWAADVADELVATKAGPSIPRYAVNGVLVFSSGAELEDQAQPLADAGAARFVRAGGQLGLLPATYVAPVLTLTDVLSDQVMAFRRYRPSSELATEVTATYTSPDRMYEDASTPAYVIIGAQAADGGEASPRNVDLRLVTDHRQAQRVAKIFGMRTRMQKVLSGVFPPIAFNLVGGSPVTVNLPSPYTGRNGIYEAEECHPGVDPVGTEGVAMRVALTLRETGPHVYAWDAATEEQDITVEAFDSATSAVKPPGVISSVSDASTVLISGDTSTARILFSFAPSASFTVTNYEWKFRRGTLRWQSGGIIGADVLDGSGDIFGYLSAVSIGAYYTVRVRAVTPWGAASDWVTGDVTVVSAGAYLSPPPTPVYATGGAGQIELSFQAPNQSDYRAMNIYASAIDDSGASVLLLGPVYGAANSLTVQTETSLGAAETRYYFARSIDRNGSISPFSLSVSATTT